MTETNSDRNRTILNLEFSVTHHTSPHISKRSQALSHWCSPPREREREGGRGQKGEGGERIRCLEEVDFLEFSGCSFFS